MPLASASRVPVEYSILMESRAYGPVVGYLAGHPVREAVIDCFGRRYTYAGVALRRRGGQHDIEARAEWIVEPGLVYRDESGEQAAPANRRPRTSFPSRARVDQDRSPPCLALFMSLLCARFRFTIDFLCADGQIFGA